MLRYIIIPLAIILYSWWSWNAIPVIFYGKPCKESISEHPGFNHASAWLIFTLLIVGKFIFINLVDIIDFLIKYW